MSFTPALGATEVVGLSADTKAFYFTYTGSRSSPGIPEVWTNLSGAWTALAFATVPSPSSTEAQADVHVASFDLSDATLGKYEFTYRKRHAESEYEWLGASGANGTIEIVSTSATAPRSRRKVELKTFALQDGESNAIESFDLDIAAQDWCEGVVWERSEYVRLFICSLFVEPGLTVFHNFNFRRIWFLTRQLHSGSPISSLSTEFEGQLLFLRGKSTSESPTPPILVLFPFTTDQVMSTIRGGEDKVWLRCMRDTGAPGVQGHVVVGRGVDGDLEKLVAECVKVAENTLSGDLDQAMVKAPKEAEPSQGVRVCTWNALGYQAYKLSDVLKWLDVLLSPSTSSPLFAASLDTVLLDDGWQDIKQAPGRPGRTQQTLHSFGVRSTWYDVASDARQSSTSNTSPSDLAASPELADAVKQIKAKGIQRVGVWMTIAGYWDGLEPHGPMARYDLQRWNLHSDYWDEAIALWYVPSIGRLEDYYGDYFKSLKAAGVDFVKVDDQAHPDYLVSGGTDDVGDLRHAMHRAMRKMSNEVFGDGTTIHCMAGSPRIWGGALALRKFNDTKSLVRNSDDYYPDQDDSHRWHIFLNGMNAILTRALEFVPDFDMGEELHPWGQDYHVPFRSFSPAPTYSTDLMTRPLHPQKGWSAALAKTKQGGAGLVKTTNRVGAGLEGRLNDDVMGEGVGQAFVVALAFPEAQGAHLGAWNTRSNEAHAFTSINSNDVVEALGPLKATAPVALYIAGHDWVSWIRPNDLVLTQRLCATPLVTINVDAKQSQMVTVAQSYTVDGIKIACLGLTDKTTGLAAIKEIAVVQGLLSTLKTASTSKAAPPSTKTCSDLVASSASNEPRSRTFPRPSNHSRLASILTYFISTSTVDAKIRPHDQIVGFGRDLLYRPLATLWTELRVWMGFSFAVVLWTLGAFPSGSGSRSIKASAKSLVIAESKASETRETPSVFPVDQDRLRITLGYASSHIGFFVDQSERLVFVLDGERIDEQWIEKGEKTEEGQLVDVNLEGCWTAMGAPTGSEWVVEVGQERI
ncbi:BQ5605_C030g10802 [Microbotryum silenes-dioicae]|uniref:BQ5605_C030g10802 protein n=1 Tax=Microbotryum silenes-dioicae TaxID=796604 RepID=A0A2X0MI44_9BASI|nr:BQ5605_C030g10802 [Microbotryum silenes-dioicae]